MTPLPAPPRPERRANDQAPSGPGAAADEPPWVILGWALALGVTGLAGLLVVAGGA